MKSCLHSTIALTFAAAAAFPTIATAANIERSTITEVVKDASILQPATKGRKAARVAEVFGVPDVLRTGSDSRVEMIAEDQTVTRVGANTIFSFEPQKREINLQKGSVLFNSPAGKGGGTIRTAAATAAVQGTTLIVVTTQNGGFKVLMMEHRGFVKSKNGQTRWIDAGQMVYALPGGDLSGVLNFHLAEQVGVSRLVSGFKKPLPSKDKIEAAIAKQERAIAKGQLVTTGLLASESPTQAFRVDNTVALDVMETRERAAQQVTKIVSSAQAGITDAIIAQPQLDRERVFSSATDVPAALGAPIDRDFSLFIARNTTVQTSTIDLSPYPGRFVFYSTGDFVVDQSVVIKGGNRAVGIVTGGTIKQAPGAFIDIGARNAYVFTIGVGGADGLALTGGSPLSLVDGGIRSLGDLSIFASSIDLNGSMLAAKTGNVVVDATGDFNAVGLGADAPQFIAPDSVIVYAGNNVKVANSVTSALHADFIATNDMKLTNVAFLTAGGPALSVGLSARNSMDLMNVGFRAENVALDARTIALTNVAFIANSDVTLRSQTGLLALRPNTGQPVELGKVNFIRNVSYGGKPAQNAIGRGITISK